MKTSPRKNWSMLPGDVLCKILENLSFPDCLHAVSTCKGWKIQIPATSRCFLPWIIEQHWSMITVSSEKKLSCKVKIHQPQNPEPYLTVCRTFDLPCGWDAFAVAICNPDDLLVKVRDAKLGWLLVELPSPGLLVLYSPFVDDDHARVLLFPPLIRSISGVTFSCPPTSSDCVVFVMEREPAKQLGKTHTLCIWRKPAKQFGTIHTWCSRDNAWKQHIIQESTSWVTTTMSMDRTLYCLGTGDRMLVFNSSNSSLKTVSTPIKSSCSSSEVKNLAAVNGGVLLICRGFRNGSLYFKVYKYDMASDSWIAKSRLDGQALFHSCPFGCVYAAPAAPMQMDNRIYRCYGEYPKSQTHYYYSFVDGQMHIESSQRFMFPSYDHNKPSNGKFIIGFC